MQNAGDAGNAIAVRRCCLSCSPVVRAKVPCHPILTSTRWAPKPLHSHVSRPVGVASPDCGAEGLTAAAVAAAQLRRGGPGHRVHRRRTPRRRHPRRRRPGPPARRRLPAPLLPPAAAGRRRCAVIRLALPRAGHPNSRPYRPPH